MVTPKFYKKTRYRYSETDHGGFFNNKVVNVWLIDTSIQRVKINGGWCGWKPSKWNIFYQKLKKLERYDVHTLYFAPLQFSRKGMVCNSINIQYSSTGIGSLLSLSEIDLIWTIWGLFSYSTAFSDGRAC